MSRVKEISSIYEKFCSAEGNQYIASEYAVYKLQQLIEKFTKKKILEVGLGIGSIAGSLLTINPDNEYTGIETNEFCLKALKENLKNKFNQIKIFINSKDPGKIEI